MARPLRLERAGALYQITYRGDGREDIFLTVDDRVVWLAPLAEACRRFNRVCHALLDDQAQRRVAKRALAEFAGAHERNEAIVDRPTHRLLLPPR